VTIQFEIIELMSNKGCGLLPPKDIERFCTIEQLGLDSIRYMELVLLVEEKLDIAMPDDLLDITQDTTVAQIIDGITAAFQQQKQNGIE